MKVFVPYTNLTDATAIALIGYDVQAVEVHGPYGYSEFFGQRWQDGVGFINVEHDCVPWPGAIEALEACSEPWCTYDYSLPCHRDRDMQHPTNVVPLGCTKFSDEFIRCTPDAWNESVDWSICDGHITRQAKLAGFVVHQHRPGIVNANSALLPMTLKAVN